MSVSLISAAQNGDRREILAALRDQLVERIALTETDAAVAPLTRQLCVVLEQLEALTPLNSEGSVLDELEKRRAARAEATNGAVAAASGRKRGS